MDDGYGKELDHICHYHEFDTMVETSSSVNQLNLEYLKRNGGLAYNYKQLRVAVPLINKHAPQGTAIFQTYYEYNYCK
jgi:hypothetical protein